MKKANKTEFIKLRCTPEQKVYLKQTAFKENKDMSSIILDKVFPSKNKTVQKINRDSKLDPERLRQEKLILGNICSSVNQLKADVNKEDAVSKLEKEVESLWHLLK